MDSSQVCGVIEEHSSSESGWTTYINSPNHENKNEDEGDHRTDQESGHDNAESDDSMASDASSGPSHDHRVTLHTEESCGKGDFKYAKDKNLVQTSGKKHKKQIEKKMYNRKKEAETEEPKHQPYRAISYGRSGAKKIK